MDKAQDLQMTPLMPPPPGSQSNFVNPDDQGVIYIVVGSIGMAFAMIFVSLRFMQRSGYCGQSAGTMIGRIALTSILIYLSLHGVGKHMWDIRLSEFPHINHYILIGIILDPPIFFFTKLSLLLLYFRLFSPDRKFKIMILAGIVFCFVAYTTAMFCYIFIDPIRLLKVSNAIGAFNVFSDIYILCLPIMAVSNLQLPTRKKIGVIMIFLSGIFACIMSIVTLIYRANFKIGPGSDFLRNLVPANTVSTVEGDVGLMCACMPFFPALVKDSQTLRHASNSVRSFSSRVFGAKNTNDSRQSTKASCRHFPKPHHSGDDYMELGEARALPFPPQAEGPKTFRAKFEIFRGDNK